MVTMSEGNVANSAENNVETRLRAAFQRGYDEYPKLLSGSSAEAASEDPAAAVQDNLRLIVTLESELQRIEAATEECSEVLQQSAGVPEAVAVSHKQGLKQSLSLLKAGCEQLVQIIETRIEELGASGASGNGVPAGA